MIKVVVVDDSETIREGLKTLINRTEGYSCVGSFAEYSSMLSEIGQLNPDVLLIDLDLPDWQSINGIKKAKLILPDLTILVLTIYAHYDHIFDALCAGASGYLIKKNPPKKLIKGIDTALHSGTPMSSSIALKVMRYFNQKKNKTLSGETEILTQMEKDILDRLTNGYSFKAIADSLEVSIETVQTNFKSIYKKLHVHSGVEQL